MCKRHVSLIVTFTLIGFANASYAQDKEKAYALEIEPYVKFLKQSHLSPTEYIISLFDKHDIVIVCERHHAEASQYELFFQIISNQKFIEGVGRVFTEIGTRSMNGYLNDFMLAKSLSDQEVDAKCLYIYRNFCSHGLWEKSAFYYFIKELYYLNTKLQDENKISLEFTDNPLDWNTMTPEKWEEIVANRDRAMADYICSRMQEASPEKKKALVIMNFRHAFNDAPYFGGKKGDDVGRYLFVAFPGRVANVLIHDLVRDSRTNRMYPIQEGKWDATFKVLGNPNVGFNFSTSPFGSDKFDLFPYQKNDLKYKDVFTGFVFYRAINQHSLEWGIPNIIDDQFKPILIRRLQARGLKNAHEVVEMAAKQLNHLTKEKHSELKELQSIIEQWLSSQKPSNN